MPILQKPTETGITTQSDTQSLPEEEKPAVIIIDQSRRHSCGRAWLCMLALVMVTGMIIGIIFVAHQYYK